VLAIHIKRSIQAVRDELLDSLTLSFAYLTNLAIFDQRFGSQDV
jgi:hypothetical protein